MEENKEPKKQKEYIIDDHVVSKVSDIDFSGTYSYANYLRWEIEERLEIIKGKIFPLAAPNALHQGISGEIFFGLRSYLMHKQCKVFIAPFDVRFPGKSTADEDVFTVVQPDICVICETEKIDMKGCLGAPDLLVEILSAGNSRKELKIKYQLYQEFGVREYWIVDPKRKSFVKYVLNTKGLYDEGQIYKDDYFVSDILPGFRLNIAEVFGYLELKD